MFWWLTHGIDAPEGGLSMPGFPDLPPDDRWALIDFIRAHNAGVTLAAGKSPGASVPAPDLPIRCSTQAATQMRDLRGAPVLVVAATEATADATGTGTPVIQLDLRDDLTEAPRSGCVAATPDALPAFAILANQHPAALPGYAFLVDANGWLGVLCRANPAAIERAIVQQPAQPRGAYVHHH
jgi:hypothetical protein